MKDNKSKYYQPKFDENGNPPKDINGSELWSFEVYKNKELAQKHFPNTKILEYSDGDIENPTFVDN